VAHSDRHRDILLRLGADRVVQPLQEMGGRLAEDLAASGVIKSMPVLPGQIIAEVIVQAGQTGQTIADCTRRRLIVLALVREGSLTTGPTADTSLREGDLLVLLGEEDRIDAFGRAA
jgi:trk system potassium uptake protein TrkA